MKTTNSIDSAKPELQTAEVVLSRVPVGRSKLYAMIREGKFPAPVSIPGGHLVAWRASDIDAWIESLQPAPRYSATAVWTAHQAQPATV